jgi:glycosyltransferase involved in cell wall biosynthesis
MTPRVSVVIPAYNNAEYIVETMESVLAQDYEDLEVIVADHSSADGTAALLARFADDPRVTLLTTEAGGGAVRNWNRVSQQARGELIKLVCGDDLLEPTAVSEQVAEFDAHPSAVLVASQRDIVDHHGVRVVRKRGLAGLRGLVDGRVAARRTVVVGSNIFGEPACVLLRRDVLAEVGWWCNDHPFVIDEATYIAVMLHGDVVALPRSLASFRISATQWSVALVKEQSSQVHGMHRALRAEDPALLSARDVRVGNARVVLMAFLRRMTYVWLRRRMGS